MKFTLATCVRNEGPYLLEWVAHYKQLGFDRIVIFSNDNDDGSDELLAAMHDDQLIEWRPRTLAYGESPQLSAYKLFSNELFADPKEQGGYLAWLDCDEFLVLKQHSSIQELLQHYQFPDALFVNWKHFGSAGQQKYQHGHTISRFLTCDSASPLNKFGKSISRLDSSLYAYISNHRPIPIKNDVWGRIIYAADFPTDVPVAKEIVYGHHPQKLEGSPIFHDVCQLNHYAVRSKEEYVWKTIRGNGRFALDNGKKHFKQPYFGQHDLNTEIELFAHEKYVTPIQLFISELSTKLTALETLVVDQIIQGSRSALNANTLTNKTVDKIKMTGLKSKEQQSIERSNAVATKNLFVLRCHNFGEAERSLLDSVLPYFGKDNILIVADERARSVSAKEWKKASLTNEKLREIGVLEHPNCGWLCGDYFYYIAFHELPGYDYYWLCEPDVYFSFTESKNFFQKFENNSADLLAPQAEKKDKKWFWFKNAAIMSNNVYGCLFPITRLSKDALRHLHGERQELTTVFQQKKMAFAAWPNDESFVCTTLQRDGFDCQNLNQVCKFFAGDFSLAPILWDVAVNKLPVKRVLHPVLRMSEFQQKARKAFKQKTRNSIASYQGKSIFLNSTSDASIDVMLNALDLVYADLRASLLKPHPGLSTTGLEKIDATFQELQTLKKYVIKQHSIKKRQRKFEFSTAQPGNFILGESSVLEQFHGVGYSPYGFDFSNKVFYLTQNDKHIEDSPFMYQAQFANASGIVTLPLSMAGDVYGSYVDSLQPTFIFSTGRCGSTLLSKLTKSLGKVNISEPDIFTSLVASRKKIKPHEMDRVLFYTVRALETFFDVSSSNQLVIKLRANCNRLFSEVHRNFPSARYVFISREIYPWSKSFIRAFNWSNEQLFNTLVGFIDALVYCKQNNVEIHHISYETLVANPGETLKLLTAENDGLLDEQFVELIMSKHSQVGTGLEQTQDANVTEVEQRARKFEEFWHQNKPVEKMRLIGIEL